MAGNFFGDETGQRSKALQFMQAYKNPRSGDKNVFWEVGDENKRPKDFESARAAIDAISSGDDLLRKMLEQMFLQNNQEGASSAESQYFDIASPDYKQGERPHERWMRRAGI